MTIRDLLKKKEKLDQEHAQVAKNPTQSQSNSLAPPVPEFTFVRTTTNDQEVISPPTYPGDHLTPEEPTSPKSKEHSKTRRLSNLLHRPKPSPSSSPGRPTSPSSPASPPKKVAEVREGLPSPTADKRRSSVLHIRKRASTVHSENVPINLPDAPLAVTVTPDPSGKEEDKDRQAQAEARWEKRATLLAETQSRSRSVSAASGDRRVVTAPTAPQIDGSAQNGWRPGHARKISDQQGDVNIQEAIRLHETGELEQATKMFGQLADPKGSNNALSQVLYGLSLRHGWGCEPNADEALTYLTFAASNSAAVESAALSTGASAGGAAKGELVLAIFELGNCFRYGWGTQIDKAAARQYYETAANLGDVDAMSEVAWCYLEGFGGPKDKWKAAQYLRRAEEKGKKEIGNSWIWKPKYEPDAKHKEPKVK